MKNSFMLLVLIALFAGTLIVGCDADPIGPTRLPKVDPATVLFVDDFEQENNGRGASNWNQFENWDVIRGFVDLHGTGYHADPWPGNGLYVDLDGSRRSAGTLETKAAFELQSGEYIFEFVLAGNGRIDTPDTVVVSLGHLFEETIIMNKTDPFRLFTRPIAVSQSAAARIRFAHAGGDDYGILLNMVRLRRKAN